MHHCAQLRDLGGRKYNERLNDLFKGDDWLVGCAPAPVSVTMAALPVTIALTVSIPVPVALPIMLPVAVAVPFAVTFLLLLPLPEEPQHFNV